jgi:16S rRNA (adenine1518-N6/adenine1519-N6)-dimethyltransferase
VIAVEIDSELAAALHDERMDNVTVVNEDILRFEPARYLDSSYVVVANLPYHITSPALRHLLVAGPPFAQKLVVMVQAEVAERISARPGEMSALAVALQAQATVHVLRRVPSSAFYPRPKVDSAVVVLEPLPEADRAIGQQELAEFTTLLHAGFKQPRKTLANSLSDGLNLTRAEANERLTRAGIDAGLRPQALTVDDWVRLFRTP